MIDDNKNTMEELNFKRLELLYKETAAMFRHFLNWRQLLFAGYFAIISALALGFKWALEDAKSLSFLFPLVAALISLVFLALDRRNRQLFYHESDVGENLEKELGFGETGYFSAFKSNTSGLFQMTHMLILTIFYLLVACIMMVLSYLLYFEICDFSKC